MGGAEREERGTGTIEHRLACCVAACRLPQHNMAQQRQHATRQRLAPTAAHHGARKPHRSMPSHAHAADQLGHARECDSAHRTGLQPLMPHLRLQAQHRVEVTMRARRPHQHAIKLVVRHDTVAAQTERGR